MIFINNYLNVQAETKKFLQLQGWTYQDLAKATGYKTCTIEAFMSKTGRKTEDVKNAILKVITPEP